MKDSVRDRRLLKNYYKKKEICSKVNNFLGTNYVVLTIRINFQRVPRNDSLGLIELKSNSIT